MVFFLLLCMHTSDVSCGVGGRLLLVRVFSFFGDWLATSSAASATRYYWSEEANKYDGRHCLT
jgi:hypothetical protein